MSETSMPAFAVYKKANLQQNNKKFKRNSNKSGNKRKHEGDTSTILKEKVVNKKPKINNNNNNINGNIKTLGKANNGIESKSKKNKKKKSKKFKGSNQAKISEVEKHIHGSPGKEDFDKTGRELSFEGSDEEAVESENDESNDGIGESLKKHVTFSGLKEIETNKFNHKSDSLVVPVNMIKCKLEPSLPTTDAVKRNSVTEGLKAFHWLINPVKVETFFNTYWEKRVCLVRRHQQNFYKNLISLEAIDKMLLENSVEFTKNIDITSYEGGERKTLNPEGRAFPADVWKFYNENCSVRLLNPHVYMPELYNLNSTLQEYFHCFVGANAYLTPPGSQGFAPHFDDIEAFVLQIEGRKRWKLYKPRHASEYLPRFSSPNFSQDEIGEPILEQVLEPGDLLYFPRGTIHQACTEPGYHSLHITLSVYQKQSYADLFERILPLALERVVETNLDIRSGLPLNMWHNAGIAFSEVDSKERADFQKKIKNLLKQFIDAACGDDIIDAAVDRLGKKFQHEALPPKITPDERKHTVFGTRNKTNKDGLRVSNYDITVRTNIRLIRANIMRLVKEDDTIRVYYHLDNSKQYCEYEPNFLEIEAENAAIIEVLIKAYPEYIGVSQMPCADDEQKIEIADLLFSRGLLMLEKPIN